MRFPAVTTLILLSTTTALAEEKAHQHGQAALDVAIEQSELQIRLTAPADDIVGFEHAPHTDAEKAAIAKAVAELKRAGKILGPASAAGCEVTKATVSSALIEDDDHDDHGDHGDHKDHDDHKDHGDHKDDDDHKDHSDHKDDDHKDHGDHDEDAHGHDDEEHAEDVHSEFAAEYHLECKDMAKLTHLDIGYFDLFPRTTVLSARVLAASGQTSVRLTPEQNRLTVQPGS